MNFKVIDNGKEIVCNIVDLFRDDNNDVNYIVYTDGTKDDDGELELYASRYTLTDNNYILKPIENDFEWNLIDNMLEARNEDV